MGVVGKSVGLGVGNTDGIRLGAGLGIFDGLGLGRDVGAPVSGHTMQVIVMVAAATLPSKPVG